MNIIACKTNLAFYYVFELTSLHSQDEWVVALSLSLKSYVLKDLQ